ncbi:MAG: leucyl/phenylalanyl-tRNA--protein transferase [Gammaproteobacteria bacterium]
MAFRIRTLLPEDPPDSFPDPAKAGVALGYPDGLLAIGGDLSPPRLLAAYRRGIFPWYNDDQPVLWWSPDPRAVILPSGFHMSRSTTRMIRRGGWQYSLNKAFHDVISGCARNRGRHGTWITPEMQAAYQEMHAFGYAHSVESWFNGALAGGIYGIRLGGVFFGESMFSLATGGSKIALSGLIAECLAEDIAMLDCQLPSDHLRTLGMVEMARDSFLAYLHENTRAARPRRDWRFEPKPAEPLISLRMQAG